MGKKKKPTTVEIVLAIAAIVEAVAAIIGTIRWW